MKRVLIMGLMATAVLGLAAKNSFPEKGTPEDFARWQEKTRAQLREILFNGPAPAAVPLQPELGRTESRPGYDLTEVTFYDRPGHKTHGFLARPKQPGDSKLPAVISLHGHDFGAYDTFNPQNMYFYGDLLASRGYVVFAPDIGHDFIDHDRPLRGVGPLPKNVPFPYAGQKVWMVMRAVDFLQSLEEVDPEKIGVVGLSNGGFTSLLAAAVDERIKLTVASGNLIMHDRMWHAELFHCRCQYLDKMDGVLDYYDVAALIAPRPLVLQNGKRDPIFPIHSAQKAFAHVKRAYELAGAPDLVIHDVHPGAHAFEAEVPLKWFAKCLPLPGG